MSSFIRMFAVLASIFLAFSVCGPSRAEVGQDSRPYERESAQQQRIYGSAGNTLLDDDDDEYEDDDEEFEDRDEYEDDEDDADGDDDEEVEIPDPPPPLMTSALGDTIHLKDGRRILGVIVVRKAPTEIEYESFFDHPMNARRYMHSVSIFDVDRVEKSTVEDRAMLRADWDRKLGQVAVYKQQIEASGLVMFRGNYVTPEKIEEVKKRERAREEQIRQVQTARRETARQRAGERTAATIRERRRQVAASLRAGQNAAVLNMLGSPSSRRDIPLFTGAIQTEVVWRDLGLRVIVQNGYVAFLDRFASTRNSGITAGQGNTVPSRSPASPGR